MNMKFAECIDCHESWNLAPWCKSFMCESCGKQLKIAIVPCLEEEK